MRKNVTPEIEALAAQMLASKIGFEEAVERFESGYVREAVRACNGNQSRAANRLGLHRNTITRILKRNRRWFEVYRLSTGRLWPRKPLDDEGQERCAISEQLDPLPDYPNGFPMPEEMAG